MKSISKKVIGFIMAVILLVCIGVGGIITVVVATITCGVALVSPVDEAKDILGTIKEGVSDTFFDVLASAEQKKRKENAALIVRIGQERNFSPHSIGIAIATAIQESKIENLPFQGAKNDHKSLGLFQQQPPWWGTPEQIMDPVFATNAFYDALQEVPDRDMRPMIDVAIEVQIPDEKIYRRDWSADREEVAMSIVKDNYTGDGKVGDNCTSTARTTVGWQLPLESGVYSITDGFGWRCLFVCKNHDGVDLAAAAQTPIFAAHDGEVTFSGENGTYGNFVRVDHGDGIITEYAHMSAYESGVDKGSKVSGGQVIGYVGTTGGSTGNHLHFNVKVDGKYVDPVPWMLNQSVNIQDNQR